MDLSSSVLSGTAFWPGGGGAMTLVFSSEIGFIFGLALGSVALLGKLGSVAFLYESRVAPLRSIFFGLF